MSAEPVTRLPPWLNTYMGPKSKRVGMLDCECWCRLLVVPVHVADVRAGRTRSCGREGCCEPPQRAA